jgi:hypothetical protein
LDGVWADLDVSHPWPARWEQKWAVSDAFGDQTLLKWQAHGQTGGAAAISFDRWAHNLPESPMLAPRHTGTRCLAGPCPAGAEWVDGALVAVAPTGSGTVLGCCAAIKGGRSSVP